MNDSSIPKSDLDQAPAAELPEHYIEAQTSLVERVLRTLKQGDTFAVLDTYGDVGTFGETPEGLFMRDTRYLSLFEMRIEGRRPLLLGSVIQNDNAALTVDLANPDVVVGDTTVFPRDIISIDRTKVLWDGVCYERIGLRSFDDRPRTFRVSVRFDADFRDLFEVRGAQREKRGTRTASVLDDQTTEFVYTGLDSIVRRTRLRFEPVPSRLETNLGEFTIRLAPGERTSLFVRVTCDEGERRERPPFLAAYRGARQALRATRRGATAIDSTNSLFDEMLSRSLSDLSMLVSQTPEGPYPYAGVPWFSTVFGRDGIITAMLMLWLDPSIAKGVLRYLAANQATSVDPDADAQPGKILHERRCGEMAVLGEVPFRRYYGTVDATPLFVMLAGMYVDRTGDRETIEAIWPNIEAALTWCDTYGDRDGDGFVEYFRETPSGLANQGWKDSQDSIFHADGRLAEGPIALCEVQGYVYAAKHAAARMASMLGHSAKGEQLEAQAEALKARFDEAFWCEEIGTYALALDGAKRPCRVRSSNAGHALFTGIADPARAASVAGALMSPEGFSGWGIRTIAQGEPRYNPMSYHNGSVWPHDNALIGLGFARYGLKREAARVLDALFEAATYQDLRRLPELYCGFIRRPHRGPTAYPVACSPQAWAAAAPYGLIEACLGLGLRHAENEIRFSTPYLPASLDGMVLRGLRLGDAETDLAFRRGEGEDVTLSILSRQGEVGIVQER
ncbi:amylo-alpha-1,6-glucosidase [Enterovirga rhinocerotis]|uniref:Glycogen debranching enzyme n=1 Tax=Enterovirga rhinocerotis TaxID=1339210 RepID=A0A4R7BYU3_9HYPH|nr:amylo-alpha-1,6-glucosidase [Enterovirga rhinocerotis]TDR90452.1 glycogen debranching enzyme [Enterovirga rhinocerotis]